MSDGPHSPADPDPTQAQPPASAANSCGAPLTGSTIAGGRLQLLRVIGEGASGVVYEGLDAERGTVAVKVLTRGDGVGVYRFKREFRRLADLRHPNLVRLHELFSEDREWFFTMELVDGVSFVDWVRPSGRLDDARLRQALRQTCAGIAGLHAAGVLHRDLKPSNVSVTAEGRVVILDFGLATEPGTDDAERTFEEGGLYGTPAYMAPEQAAGRAASVASDCYALGTMLFEALTGTTPFPGWVGEVLKAKQHRAAPRASARHPEVPSDLDAHCAALLERDPAARLGLRELRAQLGAIDAGTLDAVPAVPSATLVGRSVELEVLRESYRATLAGETVWVFVHGESGIGKTALCEAFLQESKSQSEASVLSGRCREHETVPFKALDAITDELMQHLRRLPSERAAAILPRDASLLPILFPVLSRVPAIAKAPRRDASRPQDLRRRAFDALLELLARIRDRGPLIVCIDDLQWADADSVGFLRHMLVDRDAAPALVLAVHRSDAPGGPLASVREAAVSNAQLRTVDLPVGPLPADDARALALRLIGPQLSAADESTANAIANDAGGNPFFVSELCRFICSAPQLEAAPPRLSDVVLRRVQTLSTPAQHALELLALVGQPLTMSLLFEAASIDRLQLEELRAEHLVRSRDHAGGQLVECYHDRIRQIIHAGLSVERTTQLYRALAAAISISARGAAEAELHSACLEAIGDRAGAAERIAVAAEAAAGSMAFERAASLYRRALDLAERDAAARRTWLAGLGLALENSGRGREAAEVYQSLAEQSDGDDRLEWLRRAAEQLLVTGQLEDGVQLIRRVCSQVQVGFPSSQRRAMFDYFVHHARLRLRGFEPAREPPNPRQLLRLRTANTLVTGLLGSQPVFAACSAARYLSIALEAHDSEHLFRSLGFNAYFKLLMDPTDRTAVRWLARMESLPTDDRSIVGLIKGGSAYHCRRFDEAQLHLDDAKRASTGRSGVEWEVDAINIYRQLNALERGEVRELVRDAPSLIEDALRRGRGWSAAMLGSFGGLMAWLVTDDVAGYAPVRKELARVWGTRNPPLWPDFTLLIADARCLIYQGDFVAAHERFEARVEAYRNSQTTRGSNTGRVAILLTRGRCAAGALQRLRRDQAGRARALAIVSSATAILRREADAWCAGHADTLEAAVAVSEGDHARAAQLLRASVMHYDSASVGMVAAAARRCLGQLLGGPEGAAFLDAGDSFMRRQGVRNLDGITRLSTTGCWPQDA